MKANYEALLSGPAPVELCRAVGAPPESTLGEALARGMCLRAALYDTAAAKEIREVTEGRIPNCMDDKNVIDYSAGLSAKELLMSKLEPREGLRLTLPVRDPRSGKLSRTANARRSLDGSN
jgi:hypothetical protein